ncbi:MAG: GAF domain-containing sensor histidine kinase [Psychrosphaera sp.]|nr:GAF domain-containing sensor histidine kinase [Psychrosphaera sp.]
MTDSKKPAVWCVEHQQPFIMNDVMSEYPARFGEMPKVILGKLPGALMYWPLIVGEQIIGVLTVQSYQKNAYNEPQQNTIKTLASATAIALDNAHAYREIEQKRQQLEQKNAKIIATQQQLLHSEKMASLGTLTAGVAHEINNPNNFVHISSYNLETDLTNFQQFLLELAGDDADEDILDRFEQQFEPLFEHLNTIKSGTKRIKIIVEDLRAFTQLDCAAQKTVTVTELLQSTLNLVQIQYQQVTEFITEFASNLELNCFPAQLNQVFMSLIVNACDAIKNRQQQTPGKGQIHIACQLHDEHIKISIKDNGCGMTAETQKHVFEPFYTTKDIGEGTGLGLSIAWGIVQQHGGELSVESQVGVGSTFLLRLPLSNE